MSSVMSDQALIRTTSWGVIGGIVLTLFLILLGNINAGDVNERQRVDRNTRYGASSGTAERVIFLDRGNFIFPYCVEFLRRLQ